LKSPDLPAHTAALMKLPRYRYPLLFCLGLLAFLTTAQARPNIIAICTDDQARWGMSAYGNSEVQTPNMDRIAAEGALFLNAFCNTPVCSPSRATYLTGLYSTQVGITDWIAPNEAEAGVGLKDPTWPQALQSAGYATALIGKWHLGELEEFHPTKLGFDHFMGFLSGGNRPMDPTLEVDGKNTKLEGSLPDILTSDAIRWIDEQDKPFALCLHYRAPHGPYLPVPAEDSAPYKDLDPKFIPELKGLDMDAIKQMHRDYYSSISSIDRNIGRLLDALSPELEKNTVILFTSDHGYNLGRHYISTKGNGVWMGGGRLPGAPNRPNLWDHSLRVPMAVRWPGVVEPGREIEQMVSFVDLYRTMLSIAEVEIPKTATPMGADFSPLLRGESEPDPKTIFAQYDLHNSGLDYLRMVRTHRYKYVKHFHSNGTDEFYDLESDPEEMKNILRRNKMPENGPVEAFEMLKKEMNRHMQAIDDPLLKDLY